MNVPFLQIFYTYSHSISFGEGPRELGQWRSNQSILKEINPEYSLEGLTLKLKLQNFGHEELQRADSLEKALILGKVEGMIRW